MMAATNNTKNTKSTKGTAKSAKSANSINRKKNRLEKKIKKASDAYYNGTEPIMSDSRYDELIEELREIDPDNNLLKKVGSTPPDDEKTQLPVQMGSLEKTRPSNVRDWLRQLPKDSTLIVTPKLDGLSGLLHYRDGKLIGAYTRGDGVIGRAITEKAKNITGVLNGSYVPHYSDKPTKTSKTFYIDGDVFVKGEFVIHNTVFEKHYKGESYKNARNFVAGMINRKEITKDVEKALRRMCFVTYYIETPEKNYKNKTEQLRLLNHLGFITVNRPWLTRNSTKDDDLDRLHKRKYELMPKNDWRSNRKKQRIDRNIRKLSGAPYSGQVLNIILGGPENISGDLLRKYIVYMNQHCDIQQDGLVIEVEEHKNAQKLGYEANGLNPVWARSIKPEQEDQTAKVGRVARINWNYTKRKILKPTIVLKKSLEFKGVEVSNVFAHNAKHVQDSGIGEGAKVKIIRSGDVIPYVLSTVRSVRPELPDKCPYCDHQLKWTSVDIYCANNKCSGKEYVRLQTFISTIGIDEVSTGTIDQLWKHGYKSVSDLLKIKEKDLRKIEGFGEKKAKTVEKGIKGSVKNISLAKLMHASGCFSGETSGLGDIRLQSIVDELGPDAILSYRNISRKKKKMLRQVERIDGLSEKSAELFVSNLPEFLSLYDKIKSKVELKDFRENKGKLKGMTFCFTGFRDKHLMNQIENNGGQLSNSVSNKLDVLFARDFETTKAKQARKKGVEIVSMAEATNKVQRLLK